MPYHFALFSIQGNFFYLLCAIITQGGVQFVSFQRMAISVISIKLGWEGVQLVRFHIIFHNTIVFLSCFTRIKIVAGRVSKPFVFSILMNLSYTRLYSSLKIHILDNIDFISLVKYNYCVHVKELI